MNAFEAKRKVEELAPKMLKKEKENVMDAIEGAVKATKYKVDVATYRLVTNDIIKWLEEQAYTVKNQSENDELLQYLTISWAEPKITQS